MTSRMKTFVFVKHPPCLSLSECSQRLSHPGLKLKTAVIVLISVLFGCESTNSSGCVLPAALGFSLHHQFSKIRLESPA